VSDCEVPWRTIRPGTLTGSSAVAPGVLNLVTARTVQGLASVRWTSRASSTTSLKEGERDE